ncbi:hypothetical protein GCM10011390_32590 [Aureimonas endophytica]|uniref:Glycosyltransferase 2-like domain-containing protein n=1 Tax=Aureimonas endophytica TaxID=2027858 RepID=A0A917E782_9HYPH|nr:glycosyltransferase [Aureimonas endophytica]GGE11019.1 hypothetical protein GCM10011390_32590 [Aureimonas endophytica]
MVTLPERLDLARRSIGHYLAQTLPDTELVLVANRGTPEMRAALAAHLEALGRADIRLDFAPDDLKLGALRNRSVALAAGEFVCQWDDDDWHHPDRLRRQHECLAAGAASACTLQDLMHYFPARRVLHLVNWHSTPAGGHPGTLFARRTAMRPYPEAGAAAARGEDLEVALAFREAGALAFLQGAPELYVYATHGTNTWDGEHHAMLANELAVSRGLLQRRESALRAGLAPFGFPAGTIELWGSNGLAFTL